MFSLLEALRSAVGGHAVRTDNAALALAASDLYSTGERPLAVVRPADSRGVAAAILAATSHGCAVLPRGGGLSYTSGYTSVTDRAITLDLGGLDRILAIAADDLYVTAQAGVTWKQLYEALRPLGLRLPFFGTFSGFGATIGGGLSHGALFFGSARYGSAAENALGLEVALADGTLLRTGMGALARPAKPILRTFGPDLTGLLTHDGGAFGVKTEATLRVIRTPAHADYLSFVCADLPSAAAVLSAIAREDIAEEIYILDAASVDAATKVSRADMARSLRSVVRAAGGPLQAARALASLARGGMRPVPDEGWTVHVVAAGRSARAVADDVAIARRLAAKLGGAEIAPTVPRVARADLFAGLNGVLDHDGRRWAALNAKVAHSDARIVIDGFDRLLAPHAGAMARHGVTVTRLCSALGSLAFSFECVFHWPDAWLPMHREAPDPAWLAGLTEPLPNPAARDLVAALRAQTVAFFRDVGAASNQIGRTYPFMEVMAPETKALLRQLKALLDPKGLMNPGVLGFGTGAPADSR
ncbi:MAG: FAD-binding oxidoreductase [Steroidobacteraceae bacterium]